MSAKEKSPDYQFPFYYIEGGRPNHTVRDPMKSEGWKALLQDERNGSPKIKEMYPLSARQPRAMLGVTREIREEQVIARADSEGNIITEDPDVAEKALASVQKINPFARLHPMSMPLPDRKGAAKRPKTIG